MKRQRTYRLTVQGQTSVHIVSYPLTIRFEIDRHVLAACNTARITVYNLNQELRNDIFQDRYDTSIYRAVKLNAGYETDPVLPVIFQGNMWSCGYHRPGVDFMTDINAFDGGDAVINPQAQIDLSVPNDVSIASLIRSIVGTMPNVAPGAISDVVQTRSRGITVSGNSWQQIQKLAGNNYAFIDNGRVNVLAEDEYVLVNGAITIISASTGLIGTPRRQNRMMEVDVLFEPNAVPGQLVKVESANAANNGYFTVRGVRHSGTISGSVDGGVITTLTLFRGLQELSGVRQVVQEALQ